MEPEYEGSEGPGWWILGVLTVSLVLGLVMLLMVGCQPEVPAIRGAEDVPVQKEKLPFSSMPMIQADQLSMATADGTYRVILDFPESPPENREFQVSGTVFDSSGPVAEKVKVVFDAGMPHHGHGLALEVETTRKSDGGFVTPGVRFHMKGRWLLTVDIQEGPHLERARAWVRVY